MVTFLAIVSSAVISVMVCPLSEASKLIVSPSCESKSAWRNAARAAVVRVDNSDRVATRRERYCAEERKAYPGYAVLAAHTRLLVSQSHVAIRLLASHFPAKPSRRLEFAIRHKVGEFYLRHYQTGMFAAIDVNLDQ